MNTLKVRDDRKPIHFHRVDGDGEFQFTDGSKAPWSSGDTFEVADLRKRIEPWLTSLFQSEHLTLLAGSGLTHAVHHLAVGIPATAMSTAPLSVFNDEVTRVMKISAGKAGRTEGNFEDQVRVVNELLRGVEILGYEDKAEMLQDDLDCIMQDFARSILRDEMNMAGADPYKRENAFNILVTFLMSFASRSGIRERLSIFTTNYDRLIEAGAELAGLHLLDRFVGNLTPIFRSSRLDVDMHYNPPGIRGEPRYLEGVARFTKLHGSVDWVQVEHDIRRVGLPFGARALEPYLDAPGLHGVDPLRLMIYPNAAKDRETAEYPYVELFRDLAATICRPNTTLLTYGYSFGDEHINRVIRDMLTIPSTHLVIVSRDDRLNRIADVYKSLGRAPQISLLIGPDLADLQTLTENYLPKAAIDKTMSRMGRLLQQRFGMEPNVADNGSVSKSGDATTSPEEEEVEG